ncbi:MAG TPA: hypothetical protein PK364_00880 [Synergistaceae bacterium]|nr:hypothetical protein [Synergistaceae bacterium]HPJ25950.1 hypothetical protein [Synergistaceae bacterium]HPQ37870.1 hypothetical protein [Synergistaceae bacterium]
MATCEKLETCPFFNGQILMSESIAASMKERYCLKDKTLCARYMVASAGKPVPPGLYPNQVDKARKILESP